jgi:hypothetical protein
MGSQAPAWEPVKTVNSQQLTIMRSATGIDIKPLP